MTDNHDAEEALSTPASRRMEPAPHVSLRRRSETIHDLQENSFHYEQQDEITVDVLVAMLQQLCEANVPRCNDSCAKAFSFRSEDITELIKTIKKTAELAPDRVNPSSTHICSRDVAVESRHLLSRRFGLTNAEFVALYIYSYNIANAKLIANTGIAESDPTPSDELFALLTRSQRESALNCADARHHAHEIVRIMQPLIDVLQSFLISGPIRPTTEYLFRGGGYSLPQNVFESRREVWNCFTSASLSPSLALEFLRPGGSLFVIESASAIPIFFASAYPEEMECLFPCPVTLSVRDAIPNSHLRMIGVQGSVIALAEIPRAEENRLRKQHTPGIFYRIALQRALLFLYDKMIETHVESRGSYRPGASTETFPLLDTLMNEVDIAVNMNANLPAAPRACAVLSSGGSGKTSSLLVLTQKLLSRSAGEGPEKMLSPVFVSLPMIGERSIQEYLLDAFGIDEEDIEATPERSVILLLDSWDEVQEKRRNAIVAAGGLVSILGSLYSRCAMVVVSSRTDVLFSDNSVRAACGTAMPCRSMFVCPFRQNDWAAFVEKSCVRAAFEGLTSKEDAQSSTNGLKARYAVESSAMINTALKLSSEGSGRVDEILQSMRDSRRLAVDDFKTTMHIEAKAAGASIAEEVMMQVASVPGLIDLTGTPVVASLILSAASQIAERYQTMQCGRVTRAFVYETALHVRIQHSLKLSGSSLTEDVIEKALRSVCLPCACRSVSHLRLGEWRAIVVDAIGGDVNTDAIALCCPLRLGRLSDNESEVSMEHLSFLEYYAAASLFQDVRLLETDQLCKTELDLAVHPAILKFIRDFYVDASADTRAKFTDELLHLINKSKPVTDLLGDYDSLQEIWSSPHGPVVRGSSNAAMILNACNVSFCKLDLDGIAVCGADLRGSIFVGCSLINSDLRWCMFDRSNLSDLNMKGARLKGIQFGEESPFLGHTGAVKAVAFCPEGKRIASGAADQSVRIWDASTGRETHMLEFHQGLVNAIIFSTDGKYVISGSGDTTISVWEVATEQLKYVLKGHTNRVTCLTCNSKGQLASGSGDNSVRIWDVIRGKQLFSYIKHDGVTAVAWSPCGTRIASSGDDGSVRVWDSMTGKDISNLKGHTGYVNCVAYCPDGLHIASGGDDEIIRIFDAHSGNEITQLIGHTGSINAVSFSPNGLWIVSASDDKSLRVWEVSSSAEISKMYGHTGSVNDATFTPTGSHVASCSSDKSVRIWAVGSRADLTKSDGHTASVTCVTCHPRGTHILSGSSDKSVKVWEISSGKEVIKMIGHTDIVTSVSYNHDGTLAFSGSFDRSIFVWDVLKGVCIGEMSGHTDTITCVRCGPRGDIVASSSKDMSIRLWNAKTFESMGHLPGHTSSVQSVCFNSDQSLLSSASGDKTIRIWHLKTKTEKIKLEGHSSYVKANVFSHNGQYLASGSDDGSVRLWNPHVGDCITKFEGHVGGVSSVAFSADDAQIISGSSDRTIRVWSVRSGVEISRLHGHRDLIYSVCTCAENPYIISGSRDKSIRIWKMVGCGQIDEFSASSASINCVVASPDMKYIIASSGDSHIYIWGVASKSIIATLSGHDGPVHSVAISPNGARIISGGKDKLVHVWDTQSWSRVATLGGHAGSVISVSFNCDGTLVSSTGIDKSIRVWELSSAKEIRKFSGHTSAVNCAIFSPDSSRIISASNDKSIRLWDLRTGKEIGRLDGHSNSVVCLQQSPDGNLLLSGSHDKTLRLWDLRFGKELRKFEGHTDYVSCARFNVDCTRVFSGSHDSTLRYWDLNGNELLQMKCSNGFVHSIDVHADSQLVWSGGRDGVLRKWSLQFQCTLSRIVVQTPVLDISSIQISEDTGVPSVLRTLQLPSEIQSLAMPRSATSNLEGHLLGARAPLSSATSSPMLNVPRIPANSAT